MKQFFAKTASVLTAICMLATMISIPYMPTVSAADVTMITSDSSANFVNNGGTAFRPDTEGTCVTFQVVTPSEPDYTEFNYGTSYMKLNFANVFEGSYDYSDFTQHLALLSYDATNGFAGSATGWDDTATNKKWLSFDIKAEENPELYVALYTGAYNYWQKINGTASYLHLFGDNGYLTEADSEVWTNVVIPLSDFEKTGLDIRNSRAFSFGLRNINGIHNGPTAIEDYSILFDNVKVLSVPAVTNLNNGAIDNQNITLTWDIPADASIESFVIYCDGEPIAEVDSNVNTYTHTTKGAHSYFVRTIGTNGIYIDSNAITRATILSEKDDFAAPVISAVRSENNGFNIEWSIPNSDYEISNFVIYENNEEIARVASDVFSYFDANIPVDTPRSYKVRAITANDEASKLSAVVGAVAQSDIRYNAERLYEESVADTWSVAGADAANTETAGLNNYAIKATGSSVVFTADSAVDLSEVEGAYLKFLVHSTADDAVTVSLSSGNSVAAPIDQTACWTMVTIPVSAFAADDTAIESVTFNIEDGETVYLDDIVFCYDYVYRNDDVIRVHTFDSDDMYYEDISANPSSFLKDNTTQNIYRVGPYTITNDGVGGSNAIRLTGNEMRLNYMAYPAEDGLTGEVDLVNDRIPDNHVIVTEISFKADDKGKFSFGYLSGRTNDEGVPETNYRTPCEVIHFNEDGTVQSTNRSTNIVTIPDFKWQPDKWYTLLFAVSMKSGVPTYSAVLTDEDGVVTPVTEGRTINPGNAWFYEAPYFLAGFASTFIPAAGTSNNGITIDNIYTYDTMLPALNSLVDGKMTNRDTGFTVGFTGSVNLDASTGLKVVDSNGNPVEATLGIAPDNMRDLLVKMPDAPYGASYKLVWDEIKGHFLEDTIPADEIEFTVAHAVDADINLSVATDEDSVLQTVTSKNTVSGTVSASAQLKNESAKDITGAVVLMNKTGDRVDSLNIKTASLAANMNEGTPVNLSIDGVSGAKVTAMHIEDLLSTAEEVNDEITFTVLDPVAQTVRISGNMPHGLANQIVTLEILNPGASIAGLTLGDEDSATSAYQHIAKGVTGENGSFSFELSMRSLEGLGSTPEANTYKIRIGGDKTPVKQTKSVVYYSKDLKEDLMDAFYASDSVAELEEESGVDVDEFMLIMMGDTFDILNAFDDKEQIIEKAIDIRGSKTNLNNFTALIENSIALTALDSNMDEAFVDNVMIESIASFIGVADTTNYGTYKTLLGSTGLASVRKAITGQDFDSAEEAKETFLEQSIIKALRYPKELGVTHISKIVNDNADYLEDLGFDIDRYNDMSKTTNVDNAVIEAASSDSATLSSIKTVFNTTKESSGTPAPAPGGGSGGNGGGGGVTNTYFANQPIVVNPEVTPNVTPAAPQFKDLGTVAWAVDSINTLAAKGIINGITEDTFAPNDNVTREQFVKLLALTLDIYDANATVSFADVPADAWSYSYVASAYNAGIVKGISDREFGAAANITREDAAVMIARAMNVAGIELNRTSKTAFADAESIADYATEAVNALYESDVINGKGNNQFAPKDYMTRAEAAKLLCELLIKLA